MRITDTTSSLKRKLRRTREIVRCYQNWFTALHNVAGVRSRGRSVTYRLRSGAVFHMEPGLVDVRVINEIVCDGLYEQIERFVPRENWTVLDLGAHKGVYSIHVARSARGIRLIAVEPGPVNFRFLEYNRIESDSTRITAINAAVWVTEGEIALKLSTASWGHSLTAETDSSEVVMVPTISLSELVEIAGGTVDLAKIDIEGAEYEVLYQSPVDTICAIDRMIVECHSREEANPWYSGEELARYLESLGLQCVLIEGGADSHIFASQVD